MRMAEQDLRLALSTAGDEIFDRRVVDVHRIQIDEAINERDAQMVLDGTGYRRVTPQRRHLHAVITTRPLTRPHRVGRSRADPLRVEIRNQRHAGGTTGAVYQQGLARELVR